MKIEFQNELPESQLNHVLQGLRGLAKENRDLPPMGSWAFVAKEQEEIIGSVSGYIMYGGLHVDLLYVNSLNRGQGIGALLMNEVESYGKNNGIKFICLNTFDFEARPFYEKFGYIIEFERKGYDNNSINYYMIKNI